MLDEEFDLYTKLNKALVGFSKITEQEDKEELKALIEEHTDATGS